MAEDINTGTNASSEKMFPCLAKVISNIDPTGMGVLKVQYLKQGSGNSDSTNETHDVSYVSPFIGSTSRDYVSTPDDYNNTQKSYGMWMVPPDVGALVLVIFLHGDASRGFWVGGILDDYMNFMIPGIASTQQHNESNTTRIPVAEYNKEVHVESGDQTKFKKPKHPMADVLASQGLISDDIRGITTSSARREAPSMVFGISTPGPLDKRVGSKRGPIGTSEGRIPNAPVSRLGGTTFVMDDGDDKFLRKKSPFIGKAPENSGPPEYASVEQNQTGGDVSIPHNELVRIRTRTGHQILMHNSEDLIYIGNSKGTTWIELTSNGKIDIYASDSISVYSGTDINFTSNRDINFNAMNGNINLMSKNNINQTSEQQINCKAGTDINFEGGSTANLKSVKTNIQGAINLSGSVVSADITGKITCAVQAGVAGGTGSVSITSGSPQSANSASNSPVPVRVPQAEPWAYHENLDPLAFTPEKTRAVQKPSDNSIPKPANVPAAFGKYTTGTDTFMKIKGEGK